ncbi:MAG: BNR-4 repeat-containing protein [Planctomycetes bacterium]|nr:BNR-4 repeat-containing protein [Planctomycetota bacterium]
MDRRRFLATAISCAGAVGLAQRPLLAADDPATGSFLLSSDGCGRATGYAEANKIVTLDDKTHVAWIDSTPEGFRIRIRTLDRRSGRWSPTFTVGEALDNHGGPALTVDGEGHLHVVYYPHHHPFRYRKSKRPNDASEWEAEQQFGERCTYPTLVCGPDDTLYLTCRRSFGREPWQVELWRKPPEGEWEGPAPVARSRYPGYSHFQESLSWCPDHRVLHLGCRFHEKTDKGAYGRLQTVGYMASDDFGRSWRRSDGSPIATPATAETIEVLASGGVDAGRGLRAGAIAVDAHGSPHVPYSISEGGKSETILATPGGDAGWRRRKLSPYLPEAWRDWQMAMSGGVAFTAGGDAVVAATIQRAASGDDTWGHSTNEVVRLTSSDGGETFSCQLVGQPDPATSHWLPNIERPTGHNAAAAPPGIIYTAGPPGETNTDILSNGVYWAG